MEKASLCPSIFSIICNAYYVRWWIYVEGISTAKHIAVNSSGIDHRKYNNFKKKTATHTWECWELTPAAAPFGPLKTMGTDISPDDM